MKKRKRDQRQYDLVQQHLPGLILSTILRIVEDLGDPYHAKPGGRHDRLPRWPSSAFSWKQRHAPTERW